jgi:hypothetical protein
MAIGREPPPLVLVHSIFFRNKRMVKACRLMAIHN